MYCCAVVRTQRQGRLNADKPGLTSCVVQNTHRELWTVLNWANPGSLSDWTSFERHYVDALKFGQKRNCSDLQLAKVPARSLHLELSPAQHQMAGRRVS